MKLPVLLVVPHVGEGIPPSLKSLCKLSAHQLQQENDPAAARVFDLRSRVLEIVKANIARVIIDVDRAQHDRTMDGVTKTYSRMLTPIYNSPPSAEVLHNEIEAHYKAFHKMVAAACTDDVKLGIDCHTVSFQAPPNSRDKGMQRSEICLGDLHGATLPEGWMDELVKCFQEQFEDVAVNEPFCGNFIANYYSRYVPWLHVSIRMDSVNNPVDVSERFVTALTHFCERFEEEGEVEI